MKSSALANFLCGFLFFLCALQNFVGYILRIKLYEVLITVMTNNDYLCPLVRSLGGGHFFLFSHTYYNIPPIIPC